MDKKIYKVLCQEVDGRTSKCFEVFNFMINEYEDKGKTRKYEFYRRQARKELVLNLLANKKMMSALDATLKELYDGTINVGFIEQFRSAKWLSKTFNYYLSTNQTLIEVARENGVIDEDETEIVIGGDTNESK